ncbi:hypothetical protein H9Q70_011038 [Fusarium xylarioides]|nr:hypothetical protein H9Q70_011038 [Fusarium xylarioides]KAG5775522.1 hypothetical protein H9Q73_010814 [Fusarium xylarioides]
MSEPLESDPPLIDKDDPERLSPAALRLADDQPQEFVKYLRRVWDTNRQQVHESTKLMHQLRQVKVACHDGHLHPLSDAWVPTELLVRFCSYFLLPEERFRFVILNDQKLNHVDRSSWNCFREIGCQDEVGDQFFTDLLLTIKKAWPINVKDPGRVFKIYASFHPRPEYKKLFPERNYYKHYKHLSDDENRDNFNAGELLLHKGKWIKPSSCFDRAPDYVRSKIVLTPVSAGTDASSSEPQSMSYPLILRIPDFPKSWITIFNGLRTLQSSTGQTSIQQVAELYRALNECQLSEPERITIRRLFQQFNMIAVHQGSVIKWQTSLTCIWSPLMKMRNLAELSRLYPELKNLFVGLLGVEEATDKTILSRMSDGTPDFEMRDLFSLLNCLIATSKISIKPDELLPRRVFLGKWNRENYRFVGTEEFFIPDDQEFATAFKDNLPLLDVTAEEIVILDPLFTWLGFKDRYLSKHVRHRCIWPPTAQERKIEWDVAQRAEGILRIALHCGSPRTATKEDRGALLNILRKGELLTVEGIQSKKVLLSRQKGSKCLGTGPHRHHGFTAPSTHPNLFIPSHDARHTVDKLVVYVSSHKEERDLALFTVLPQRLMQWLMADPKTLTWRAAPSRGVSLLKNVLTAPPNVIDALLTSEGVGRIRINKVYRTTMRQEATPQNRTSKEPADQQPELVAGPSSARVSQQTTFQADFPWSNAGSHAESPFTDVKTLSKDEPVPTGDEDVYKPRYASISERPKLRPRLRKRSRSPSSSPPASSSLSQVPDDIIRGIERLRIADTSEATP